MKINLWNTHWRCVLSAMFALLLLTLTWLHVLGGNHPWIISALIGLFLVFLVVGIPYGKPGHDIESIRNWKRQFAAHLILAMQLTVGLSATVLAVNFAVPLLDGLEQSGYEFLLRRHDSRASPPPVIVVDISDVDRYIPALRGDTRPVTDRRRLHDFIDTVVKAPDCRPAVIGVDINFHNLSESNDGDVVDGAVGGFIDPNTDEDFFRFCLAAYPPTYYRDTEAPSSPQRILLGVSDCEGIAPEAYLGVADFQGLAASMRVPKDDAIYLFRRFSFPPTETATSETRSSKSILDEQKDNLATLSGGLAAVYSTLLHKPSLRIPPLCEIEEPIFLTEMDSSESTEAVSEDARTGSVRQHQAIRPATIQADRYLLDLSYLYDLQRETKPIAEYLRNPDLRKTLRNRIVLLGNTTRPDLSDVYFLRGKKVPGVFLHACGAATLVQAPLFTLRPIPRALADIALTTIVLTILNYILARRGAFQAEKIKGEALTSKHGAEELRRHHSTVTTFALFLAAILAFLLSFWLLKSFNIVWGELFIPFLLYSIHFGVENTPRFWQHVEHWLGWRESPNAPKTDKADKADKTDTTPPDVPHDHTPPPSAPVSTEPPSTEAPVSTSI